MTASREFNFEAFAAKFDASLLKVLTAEVLTTKRSRRFLSGFIGTSRKIFCATSTTQACRFPAHISVGRRQ